MSKSILETKDHPLNEQITLKNDENNTIGDYKIEKTIGEGTFGKVKLGIHIPTNEMVAIKILEKSKIMDNDCDRVQNEIGFLKKLNHVNIIKIYEIIETSKMYYLIMEYASGGELFNYIVRNKRLESADASFFFAQIINGLDYIHKHTIVHRDLKPENLLITEKRIIKIIDFGLSNSYKIGQLLSTPCGSPCYAAPEMLLGKKYSGLNVDIWSTGIILYAMVCGYLPFEDKDDNLLFKKIILCNLKFPNKPNITDSMRDIISKILVVNTKKRIKLEEIKKHPFYLQGVQELKYLSNYSISNDKQKYDNGVINKMVLMGFSKPNIIKCLDTKKTNNTTSTYYILYNKFSRNDELEENNRKRVNLNKKSISNNDLNKTSNELNRNKNINININYNNEVGDINININESELKKQEESKNLSRTLQLTDSEEIRYKSEKKLIQSKICRNIDSLNIQSLSKQIRIKNLSLDSDEKTKKSTILPSNLSNKNNVIISTPKTLSSKNQFNYTTPKNGINLTQSNNESNPDISCNKICNTEIFASDCSEEKLINDEIKFSLEKKTKMDIILEEIEQGKLYEDSSFMTNNKKINERRLTNTDAKKKFEKPNNYLTASAKETKNLVKKIKFRSPNYSENFQTIGCQTNKNYLTNTRNVRPVIKKADNISIGKIEKAKINRIKKNTFIKSTNTPLKKSTISSSNKKKISNKKNSEIEEILEEKFSFEIDDGISISKVKKNNSFSKSKKNKFHISENNITIRDVHTPNNQSTIEKSELVLQKKKINLFNKKIFFNNTMKPKIQFIKIEKNSSNNNNINNSNLTCEEESKLFNDKMKLKSLNNSNINNPPPMEDISIYQSNFSTDFSCCTIYNLDGTLIKIKEFSEKKQLKLLELGNYRYECKFKNDYETKIILEFTSVLFSIKSSYLMKIFLFSNNIIQDRELVKELLMLGI